MMYTARFQCIWVKLCAGDICGSDVLCSRPPHSASDMHVYECLCIMIIGDDNYLCLCIMINADDDYLTNCI